jgi:predicted transcriptional regulator of viral defense system
MEQQDHSLTLPAYVNGLQQTGRYSFPRKEALEVTRLSPVALQHAARRLAQQGRLVSPRRGFYVIVPLEYKSSGAPPPSWFIDQFMNFKGHSYYVGLLSAAAVHGAAHQQPQEFQVLVDVQQRPTSVGRTRIRFLHKKKILSTATVPIKTETGTMKVSSPEATALDLVRYASQSGGLNNVLTILSELAEKIDADRLLSAAQHDDNMATAQRLGFLMDQLGDKSKTQPLAAWIQTTHPRPVKLQQGRSVRRARKAGPWNILVNDTLELPE